MCGGHGVVVFFGGGRFFFGVFFFWGGGGVAQKQKPAVAAEGVLVSKIPSSGIKDFNFTVM